MKKHATLADIARKSKVSISTVSLVLRDKPGIPGGTRQRVLAAASALGYKPKSLATTGPTSHSSTIGKLHNLGLILKSEQGLAPLANPFYSQVLAGIEEACRKRRVNLLYATLPVDKDNVPTETPCLLSGNHVDGLLLVGAFVDETLGHILGEESMPVVLVDAYASRNQYDAVVTDNLRGAYQAVSYLIQQGHHHIGVIGSHPNAYPSLNERRQGYLQALLDHGIHKTYFADSSLQDEEIACTALELLQRQPQVTAIFGCNDHAAISAMRGVDAKGFRLPDSVSVIGFDDIDLAQHVRPALTTMHVDKAGMGRMAVQMLANRIEFPDSERVTSVISPRLVERDSVKKIA